MAQIRQAPPILTVGGYFEINRQLIPSVSQLFTAICNYFYITILKFVLLFLILIDS